MPSNIYQDHTGSQLFLTNESFIILGKPEVWVIAPSRHLRQDLTKARTLLRVRVDKLFKVRLQDVGATKSTHRRRGRAGGRGVAKVNEVLHKRKREKAKRGGT